MRESIHIAKVVIIGLIIIGTMSISSVALSWWQSTQNGKVLGGVSNLVKDADKRNNQREAADRERNAIIDEAIIRIQNGLRLSIDCVYLRGQGLRPEPCKQVNARIDELKEGKTPFVSPGVPPATTTTVQRRALPSTTTTTRQTVLPSTTTSARPPPPSTTTTTRCGADLLGLKLFCG